MKSPQRSAKERRLTTAGPYDGPPRGGQMPSSGALCGQAVIAGGSAMRSAQRCGADLTRRMETAATYPGGRRRCASSARFLPTCLISLMWPSRLIAQDLTSPAEGTSAIVIAVRWIQDVALGSLATAAAVIAVACLGFLMLRGHLPVRRAATVLLGCFVLFGASVIAQSLIAVAESRSIDVPVADAPRQTVAPLPPNLNDNADVNGNAVISAPE